MSSDPADPGAGLAKHRAEIVAAIRACDRPGLRQPGTRLAAAIWRSAALVRDPEWWQALSEAGEALAIADRDPAALAALLDLSAATFADYGDRARAEAQWVRALAILRRAELDPSPVLTSLGSLYRSWGRLGKALDADLGLADARRAQDDPVGTAAALTSVANTMLTAGRLPTAADYFAQADELLTALPTPTPATTTIHAQILVSWGHALWDQGEPTPARRHWSRALAMLIDHDDTAAAQVRTLLATHSPAAH